MRILLLVVGYVICVVWVMRYARKVRSHPELSIVADKMEENRVHFLGSRANANLEFTATRKWILLIFAAAFAVMIYGVAVLGWWMAEISGVFLASAIIVGVIARMSEEEFTGTFIDGARDLLGVALIIGIARGIVVVMDNGMITHTILHSAENVVSGLSSTIFINVTYWLEVLLSFWFLPLLAWRFSRCPLWPRWPTSRMYPGSGRHRVSIRFRHCEPDYAHLSRCDGRVGHRPRSLRAIPEMGRPAPAHFDVTEHGRPEYRRDAVTLLAVGSRRLF